MDHRVARLKNPDECEQFARNVAARDAELARQARRRGVELRAEMHRIQSDVQTEILRAVYAYEEVLAARHGKRLTATKTWQLVRKQGALGAAETIVNRDTEPEVLNAIFAALAGLDMLDFAYESVVCRYPQFFKPSTVELARRHLQDFHAFR